MIPELAPPPSSAHTTGIMKSLLPLNSNVRHIYRRSQASRPLLGHFTSSILTSWYTISGFTSDSQQFVTMGNTKPQPSVLVHLSIINTVSNEMCLLVPSDPLRCVPESSASKKKRTFHTKHLITDKPPLHDELAEKPTGTQLIHRRYHKSQPPPPNSTVVVSSSRNLTTRSNSWHIILRILPATSVSRFPTKILSVRSMPTSQQVKSGLTQS